MTEEQRTKALELAERRDDRVMGALTYHERTSMRTAMLLVSNRRTPAPVACCLPPAHVSSIVWRTSSSMGHLSR